MHKELKPGISKIITVACLLSLFTLTACGDSDHSSGIKKDIPAKMTIEKSIITFGDTKLIAEKTGQGEKSIPGLEDSGEIGGVLVTLEDSTDNYVLLGSENGIYPDGSFAIIRYNNVTWICQDLTSTEEVSAVVKNHSVLVLKGEMEGLQNGKTVSATLRITESQVSAGSSEITINKGIAYLNGDLGTRTYNQVIDLLTDHPEIKTIVEVNVPGSVNDEVNMKTGKLLRKNKFEMQVAENGHIASGGVDLFCAGVTRKIGAGAKVGVHSWAGGDGVTGADLPEDHKDHDAQKDYFKTMLGDPAGIKFYFYTLNAAPAEEIHYMIADEIKEWGLETE